MNILATYGPLGLLFAFIVVHALADFPLQGDYLARVKVRSQAKQPRDWVIALSAHSIIHGGGVWLVSGSLWLGLAETCLHWLTDLSKGEGKIGDLTDQFVHVLCKAIYVALLVSFPALGYP